MNMLCWYRGKMTANLRDRLKRIQELKKSEKPKEISRIETSALTDAGWQPCGFQVLKKEIYINIDYELKDKKSEAIGIVIPDLAGRNFLKYKDFLFFDLETTGLSGGAGTVAFLAAFGQFVIVNSFEKLCVTQYLLLDYPGENDFIEAIVKKIKTEEAVIVTYNGKCFDSQILKTRCLMNGIKPPEYFHADLLHPARRLWKNVIHDCSQSSVETKILGLDRSGDIPGSLAPEIWFEFLKTGRTDRLLGICEHNQSDISGLASILNAMISIAADPFGASLIYDIDRLALYWRNCNRRHNNQDLQITGDKLLRFAAESKCQYSPNKKAAVFRALSIDSERKLKDTALAIKYAKMGLELKEAGQFWKDEFGHRLERLKRKLSANR